ncbi:MAG: 16S rRNA (cytosine(967)-C(5))-methyltransferase RsmB, partial [Steroidobacteraceae bacterium]
TVLASAARAVADVAARGRSADDALASLERAPDRAAVRAVTLGSLRWYLRLLPAITPLLGRRHRPLAVELRALLVVAAHQVEYSRNAPEATVDAAVDAARVLGQPRASGLVNAVLRRLVSERAALFAQLETDLASATAHPEWLVSELRGAWPEDVRSVLDGNNEHPPLVLRLDRSRVARDGYLAELAEAGCPGHGLHWAPDAVELEHPVPVVDIPGFAEGRVSVQDAGAQLAAPLLDARPGMRVLDACAAPGGKTLHLLERTPGLEDLIAIDVDAVRLKRVQDNLERAHRRARLAVMDVRALACDSPGAPDHVLGGRLFDRILVDAPCSSTGVIRRHPDIKLLRRRADIDSCAAAQLEILRSTFRVLAPGGRLLYCTCSVLPAENDRLVSAFLSTEPLARPAFMPPAGDLAPGARDCAVGVQLLPGAQAGSDGFYYACLEKTTAGH